MKNKVLLISVIVVFIVALMIINDKLNNSEENNVMEQQAISDTAEESNVLDITSENFNEVLENEKPVIIDFYAVWCGPCRILSPTVNEIANENSDIQVCRINIDDEPELAEQYGISSIPTLVVIKNGEEVDRVVGVVDKNTILEMIK